MKKIKVVVFALSIIFVSCAQEKKQEAETQEPTQEQTIVGEVKVPNFQNKKLQRVVDDYDAFMNKSINMYKENPPGSEKAKELQQSYLEKFKVFNAKISEELETSPTDDITQLQQYLLEKEQEMNTAIDEMLEKAYE